MKHLKNTTTLYDAGGLLLVLILFGLPFGIIFDYLWNLLAGEGRIEAIPVGTLRKYHMRYCYTCQPTETVW